MAAPKILIVDDERGSAIELEARLAGLGYRVVASTTSGSEALSLVAQTGPELVLMNVVLAGDMDGIDAARAIRRRWPIPVLFIVADTDHASLRRVQAGRQSGYLLKPFAERELSVGIAMALDAGGADSLADEIEERFFDVSIDMLCCLDFTGYFKRLNPAWERALGFTRDELMSRPFLEFVHPDDRERTLKQNREVRGGGQARSFENRYLCKDGSYRWLLWNATPDAPQHVIYSVARDVTERKQAEKEREQLVRRLQTALAEVRSLRDMLSMCSYCRKIRDDEDSWHALETYIARHTTTRFSHGICPTCYKREIEPQLDDTESD